MDRFWNKVQKTAHCWEWIAVKNKKGYGQFRLNGGMRLAHRVAYALVIGEVPNGMYLDHLCRNPACVNPAHLEPVTNAVNVVRGFEARGLATYCKRGHGLDDSYVDRRGVRHCRKCNNIASAAYRRRVGRCRPVDYAPVVET